MGAAAASGFSALGDYRSPRCRCAHPRKPEAFEILGSSGEFELSLNRGEFELSLNRGEFELGLKTEGLVHPSRPGAPAKCWCADRALVPPPGASMPFAAAPKRFGFDFCRAGKGWIPSRLRNHVLAHWVPKSASTERHVGNSKRREKSSRLLLFAERSVFIRTPSAGIAAPDIFLCLDRLQMSRRAAPGIAAFMV